MKKHLLLIALVFSFIKMHNYKLQLKADVKQTEPVEVKTTEYKVVATMYYAQTKSCDADPLITAGMYKINPSKASQHKWIAMSRDLIKRFGGEFNYGDKVKIEGAGHKDGVYTVVDTMNKRFRNKIDFLETEGTEQYKFTNVKVKKLITV